MADTGLRQQIYSVLCNMALSLQRLELKLDRLASDVSADTGDVLGSLQQLETKLDAISRQDSRILRQGDSIMAGLADVQAAVAAEATVVDSAVALLGGLKAALDAAIASGDPAALQALSDSIASQTAELSTAVAANTPAAPQP